MDITRIHLVGAQLQVVSGWLIRWFFVPKLPQNTAGFLETLMGCTVCIMNWIYFGIPN
jgi:hypothetical protein